MHGHKSLGVYNLQSLATEVQIQKLMSACIINNYAQEISKHARMHNMNKLYALKSNYL